MRILICSLVFIVTACSPGIQNGIVIPVLDSTESLPGNIPEKQATANPLGEVVVSTGSGQGESFTEYRQGDLWVQVISPQDEQVFDHDQIEVSGSAPLETVISINDQIVVTQKDGHFSAPIFLEEGPNLIELVVSDLEDNQLDVIITVLYEP